MPILREEPSLYPAKLFEMSRPPEHEWYVLQVKSRQEKVVARHLLSKQTAYYLPQLCKISWSGGRKLSSYVPLFPGYVFICGSQEDRCQALMTNRVAGVLLVPDQERLIDDLRNVQRLIGTGRTIVPGNGSRLGKLVRVREGPLKGLEGYVLKRCGRCYLNTGIDLIQQGASIEIEDFLLEPIG